MCFILTNKQINKQKKKLSYVLTSSTFTFCSIVVINQLDVAAIIYGSTTAIFRSILSWGKYIYIYIYIYISLPNLLRLRKKSQNIMEEVQDIVIVGAGIAGLTTSLGLHKYPSSLYFYIHVHVCTFWFSIFFFYKFI